MTPPHEHGHPHGAQPMTVIDAMRAHHAALVGELGRRAKVLADTVNSGASFTSARTEVASFLEGAVLPHAQAEEKSLYEAAIKQPKLELLVTAMHGDHVRLGQLARQLKASTSAGEAASLAGAASQLFSAHADKENDQLLPSLEAAGVDLGPLLHAMHEELSHPHLALEEDAVTAAASTAPEVQPDHAHDARPMTVIEAMRAHHASLVGELARRTNVLAQTVDAGSPFTAARDDVATFLETAVLPHARAEEKSLYQAGSQQPDIELLVTAMHGDHIRLGNLSREVAVATGSGDAATLAGAAAQLFSAHADKENDQLLPSLEAAGVDLRPLLNAMHEELSRPAQAPSDVELDVTLIPHERRHATIFAVLERLVPGQSLIIGIDHDPQALRYQMETMFRGRFAWSYVEEGPVQWRIRVRRTQ